MPLSVKLVIVYLVIEALLNVAYVGKRIEITGWGAVLTVASHAAMVWAVVAAFAHH